MALVERQNTEIVYYVSENSVSIFVDQIYEIRSFGVISSCVPYIERAMGEGQVTAKHKYRSMAGDYSPLS